MDPRTFCFIVVFVGSSTFALLTSDTPHAVTEKQTSEERKILSECRHSDYRTYIKCLKRQKRHHLPHGDAHADIDGHCMESCLKNCEPGRDCDTNCSYCLKRAKHKHQIITEYETDCTSGNCDKDNAPAGTTNITTNIDINNIINNCPPGNCSVDSNKNHCCPTCTPPVPCYPSQPPLSWVAQITVGLIPTAGCNYGSQWPCAPQTPITNTNPIDCSACGNPFLRYRCDISCYTTLGGQYGNQGYVISPGGPCKPPHCVGGGQGVQIT